MPYNLKKSFTIARKLCAKFFSSIIQNRIIARIALCEDLLSIYLSSNYFVTNIVTTKWVKNGKIVQ